MKIVFDSPNFYPLTGGLENLVMDLAIELSYSGHQIVLLTRTPHAEADQYPFQVLRRPGFLQRVQVLRAADVVVQFNVSLKGIVPWLLASRPLVVSHQTANTTDLRGRLKAWVANSWSAQNIGCSNYMAQQFQNAVCIPNSYNNGLFQTSRPWEARTKDLIFVGRLVSDKGADLLLQSVYNLKKEGLQPSLTIVGQGPEEQILRALVQKSGLEKQVEFAGLQRGAALVDLLNAHRIMVAPSIWDEPFGIVALEGLACGCWVIGSSGGGLPEAIGAFGATFPNGDADQLAACLSAALRHPEACRNDPAALAIHLKRHSRPAVAEAYAGILKNIVRT